MTRRTQQVKSRVQSFLKRVWSIEPRVSVRAANLGDADRRVLIVVRHPFTTAMTTLLHNALGHEARIYSVAEWEVAA